MDTPMLIIRRPKNALPYLRRMEELTYECPESTFFNSYLAHIANLLNTKTGEDWLAVGPEFHSCGSYGLADLAISVSAHGIEQIRDSFPVWLHESKPGMFLSHMVTKSTLDDDHLRYKMGSQLWMRLHNEVFHVELKNYNQSYCIGTSGCGVLCSFWIFDTDDGRTYWLFKDHDNEIARVLFGDGDAYPAQLWQFDVRESCIEEAVTYVASTLLVDLVKLKRQRPDNFDGLSIKYVPPVPVVPAAPVENVEDQMEHLYIHEEMEHVYIQDEMEYSDEE